MGIGTIRLHTHPHHLGWGPVAFLLVVADAAQINHLTFAAAHVARFCAEVYAAAARATLVHNLAGAPADGVQRCGGKINGTVAHVAVVPNLAAAAAQGARPIAKVGRAVARVAVVHDLAVAAAGIASLATEECGAAAGATAVENLVVAAQGAGACIQEV
jgi:hypothetical protein